MSDSFSLFSLLDCEVSFKNASSVPLLAVFPFFAGVFLALLVEAAFAWLGSASFLGIAAALFVFVYLIIAKSKISNHDLGSGTLTFLVGGCGSKSDSSPESTKSDPESLLLYSKSLPSSETVIEMEKGRHSAQIMDPSTFPFWLRTRDSAALGHSCLQ